MCPCIFQPGNFTGWGIEGVTLIIFHQEGHHHFPSPPRLIITQVTVKATPTRLQCRCVSASPWSVGLCTGRQGRGYTAGYTAHRWLSGELRGCWKYTYRSQLNCMPIALWWTAWLLKTFIQVNHTAHQWLSGELLHVCWKRMHISISWLMNQQKVLTEETSPCKDSPLIVVPLNFCCSLPTWHQRHCWGQTEPGPRGSAAGGTLASTRRTHPCPSMCWWRCMSCPTNQPFCLHQCVPQQHSVSASQAPQNKLLKTIISQRQTFYLCHCVSQQHSASVVSVSLCVTTAVCICCVCVTVCHNSSLHLLCLCHCVSQQHSASVVSVSLCVTTALCICCVCVTVCHNSTLHCCVCVTVCHNSTLHCCVCVTVCHNSSLHPSHRCLKINLLKLLSDKGCLQYCSRHFQHRISPN